MSDHSASEHITPGNPVHAPAHITATPTHGAAAPSPFTDVETAELHANDVSAARAVVILMLGIFLTGVFIYSVVAYWVINFSQVG